MRLISIRLHPFGGITDRTYSLHDGVQVLLGANEYGKSTFRAAVRHALFTPVELTPSKQHAMMGRWFPIPGGKTAAITLIFIYKGSTYTLEKRWGEERFSHLTDGSGKTVRGAREVQDRLDEMRAHGEGSYCRVFELSQAQILQTVDDLRSGGREEVNAAAAVMSGATFATGDIELESLKQHLEEQIDNACSRWDLSAGGPKRDPKTGQGGVERPWINGAGEVLRSWYTWQDALVQVHKREAYDTALDKRTQATQHIEQLATRFEECEAKLEWLSGRQKADLAVHACQKELAQLRGSREKWVAANQTIAECNRLITEAEGRLGPLETERRAAQLAMAAEATKQQWKTIREAYEKVESCRLRRANLRSVGDEQGKDAEAYMRKMGEYKTQILAYRLSARLSATRQTTLTVSTGTGPSQTVVLNPDQVHELTANGELVLKYQEVSIEVRSAQSDLDRILAEETDTRRRSEELLRETDCKDLQEVVDAASKRKAADDALSQQQEIYKGALQDKTYEEWQAIANETAAIPSSRPLAVVQAAIEAEKSQCVECRTTLKTNREFAEQLATEWTSIARLDDRNLAAAVDLRDIQKEQQRHPPLPEGADPVGAMADELDRVRGELEQARGDAQEARVSLAGLGDPGADDLESLQEAAAVAEWKHQQALELVHAKMRIVGAINKIRGDTDPFAGLGSRVMELFHQLTAGKYSRLQLDTGIPSSIERADGAQLSMMQLSQGTGASLALAVRVALIESLLQRSPLFVVLDDPFVDLDADRRARAMEVVRQLGARTQVILLTCHPAHAEGISPVMVENARA